MGMKERADVSSPRFRYRYSKTKSHTSRSTDCLHHLQDYCLASSFYFCTVVGHPGVRCTLACVKLWQGRIEPCCHFACLSSDTFAVCKHKGVWDLAACLSYRMSLRCLI